MQRSSLTIGIFFLSILLTTLYAQSSANLNSNSFLEEELVEMADDNWSFYVDEENKIYFIDFEKLNVNLSTIIVKDENGKVLVNDDVVDLPVNTIYEIDFSEYGMGEYQVEIRSYTGFIRKNVSIK